MLPLPKGAAPKFILLFLVSLLIKEISSEGRVVCYYTNWSVYRPGTAKFNPQNINPYLCTHLIYAFGGFTKDNTLKPFDKYQDIEQGGYSKFTGLKAYNKNLKTLLAIGGWNEGSSRFSPLVANPERRQQFIKNVLKFLRQNHFDGLDLDWEYPAFRDGGKQRDKENYAQFVQELRSEFDRESSKTGRPRLLLTMAVPAGTEYIEKGYDIPKLNKYLDWFNLLSYDYHSAYEPSVNHHSPLYSLEEESEYNYDADLNIDYSVKFYLQAGADRDKLVLGIPTYGRTYTLVSDDITDLGSPADGPGDQGDATREKGYLAYYEICQSLRDDPDWTIVQPNSKAMGPYAFRGDQWVGFDDEAIVKKKAEYVVENGLGGIMFWSIDNDDFRGSCGKKPYPLIEAAKEAMFDRLGVGANEVARPSAPRKPSRSRSRLGSSNRNNIISESTSTHKTSQSGKKSSSRRTSNKKRNRIASTTTTTTTTTTTPSSLYIGGRSTTPPPPTTPDPGADFKCEEEGFFPHPRDCKKYFWCLDSGPSNLGIVAHQFTCPSGLYFNTAADSCDFARNVPCKTKTTTAKPTTTAAPTTISTTIRTTTSSPRITAATSRQTFLRHSSTTEQASEEDEYEDEDEDEDESIGPEEEEDPKVIKELIQLIKKVGGLEELEKQLLQQEDGSMVLTNSKADVSSTTQPTISKSLYHKVLSRPNNLSSFRRQFETNKLTRSTISPALKDEEESVEVEESSKKSDSRYSSVVRNSRPSPQNAGIDKLPEFEGFLKEKPKYVTIQRTRPTVAVESNVEEEEENEDVSTEFIEQSTRDSKNRRVDIGSTQTTTTTPSYVNIRRTRPSTAAPESSEVTEEEKVISSTRSSYLPLNRRRISTVTTATDDVTIAPTTGTPFASTTQRYKYIERTKSSTLQPEEIKTTTGFLKANSNNVDENSTPITVQNLDLNDYTTQAPIQKIATTHIYETIARRTTLSTTPSTTLVETTTAEPTTIRAFTTTTNPTTTTISSSTNSVPLLEEDPTPVDNFQNQNSILPITDPSPNKSAGLDTDGKDNTHLLTDKKTDTIHLIGEDEVTLTDSKVKVSSSSTLSSYNITKFNEFESSLKATNPSLSKIDKQVTVTSTDILTTPNTDSTTTQQTTIQKDEIITTKDFLETVSSPRPFGFPRRRTRPTTARKPSSTTNHEIVTSTSTVTPPPTQKVSPLKKLKSNSRTRSRYQSRTNVENVSSASNNARELNEIGKGNNLHTNQNPSKRPLNTYSYSGENTDDELDNSISSRKRSYSWRSQVNRNFRPWKTTTTVGTTPLPNLGPDRTYRPTYSDERDNLGTEDSYAYKSNRDESESDSYSTINKNRQIERTRTNVRTSSDGASSQRRIGVRVRNQGVINEESKEAQRNNRRYGAQAENQSADNSYRRKVNRVQPESDSSLIKKDDSNVERNRSNVQKSSEDASSQKRLGITLRKQGISIDASEEIERGNESTDNNSNRRKLNHVQSESDSTVSTKNNADFERSRGNAHLSSEDTTSQRSFGSQGDIIVESEEIERGNRRYGEQIKNDSATSNNSNRRKFHRVQSESDSSLSTKSNVDFERSRGNAETSFKDSVSQKSFENQGATTDEFDDIERGNRRYGVQAENESADNNSSRRKFYRIRSKSGSSLSSQDDVNIERSRGNSQTSSGVNSSHTRLGNPNVSIYESEQVQKSNRRYGVHTENQSINNISNLDKSHGIKSQPDSSLSSKDETNLEQNRDDLKTSSEDVESQKRIESESGSSLSIKDKSSSERSGSNVQTSSEGESSQRRIGLRLRNGSSSNSVSEDVQSNHQRNGEETENQSSSDASSHRITSETESSFSSNSEDSASKKRIENTFEKPGVINESDEARTNYRRYGEQVDNESTYGSYRYKSNRIISNSDSTLSTSSESNLGSQRITTENAASHKRIGVKLQNPASTLHDSQEIRKSNRRYGVRIGTDILSEGNSEDSSITGKVQTSKTTTVYDQLNRRNLPSTRVVTENITQYYSGNQLSNSDATGMNEETITTENNDDKLNLQRNFAADNSGISAINSKTSSEATQTSINTSELTKGDNVVTNDSVTSENNKKQSSQSKLVKELNEKEAVSHTSSEQLTNTNIEQINEEDIDFSGKSDVRQYYTSAEDDKNTIAALHQGKIKSGNHEKTTFVRNKGTVNLYREGTSDGGSTQSSTTEYLQEEHSINIEKGNSKEAGNVAQKSRDQSQFSQSSGQVISTTQTIEEQNGTNGTPRRRIVVKKRIYRTRNNNTNDSTPEGKVSATTNTASGRSAYEQRTKLTSNRNTGTESLNKVRYSNLSNGRRRSESSISKSNIDASENLLNKEIEATENGIVEKETNTVSGIQNTSRRRIQTSRNFGTTNNARVNTISRTRTRINNNEEKSESQNVQSKENSEISENEEHTELRRHQRIRPTRPIAARTSPTERKTRPNLESDLSSLLAVDRSKWEFLDRTKTATGGTIVRRRRPLVKSTTEVPKESETTNSIHRRVRPVTSTTQSTETVRQRNQFLYRNRGSLKTNKTDEDISVNIQSEENSFRATTGISKEEENSKTKIGESSFIKKNSVTEDASLSTAQNNLLETGRTSEESLLVKTSAKGTESSSKFSGNRKKTTNYNKFDEETSEIDSNDEILSFEESQNGSFRGRSQNAVKSSTSYELKTNKATVLRKSDSSESTTSHSTTIQISPKDDEAGTSSTTVSNEYSTTLIPELDSFDKSMTTTTEESSTLIPHTTLFDDFDTIMDTTTTTEDQTTTETQTTMEPQTTFATSTIVDTQTTTYSPTTTNTPIGMDASTIVNTQTTTYSPTTTNTPIGMDASTTMDVETTLDTQTTMDETTTIDTPTTINFATTKNAATTEDLYRTTDTSTTVDTPVTTIFFDSSTEGILQSDLDVNQQLNIGERFVGRTSEKGKNSRSFQSTRQQNTFQAEKDFKNRQSTNINRKFSSNSEYINSQSDDNVQNLRGKDDVEILYHRQKYWETFNKTRSHEGDSPIIYIGTFNNNGYKPGRTGKFSQAEIQKIQEIFSTAQQTESFSENLKNVNRGRAKLSKANVEQNEAEGINESKEIRLTTTKEYKGTGTLFSDNSRDLTRSQVSKTNFGRGKNRLIDEVEITKSTEIPDFATTEGIEAYTSTEFNTEDTTTNVDDTDETEPQITIAIPENTSDQTIDFGVIDQETLTSTISLGEEETTFPPSPTTTDKTITNALDKTGLSAFDNNFSASTDGFVETTTNSNLFFSEKSQKLAQSSGEISPKFNSGGFSRSRTRISSIQQGSSKRINTAQANEINNLDLNLKVNVSKESAVSSNAVESNKFKSRIGTVLSKTNSIQIKQNSEESTAEEGLKFSGNRYSSNTGRNLKVSNFQANRRQFLPSSKRKQPNSSAESTESTLIEIGTESSSAPSETEGTTIRSTLIFLKGPRPDGRYAEEHGQDIISSFHRGSSHSTFTSSNEETEEDDGKDLLSRFDEGSTYSTVNKNKFFRDEDSVHIATENERNRDEEVKINVGTENGNEEVSTIRSTLIFLKGPKPFNIGEGVSTTSGIEDRTDLNEETATDASTQITPTRRTYVTSNRSKVASTASDDSSITRTNQQNEDLRSTLTFRRQQSPEDYEEITENLNISVKTTEDEESTIEESDVSSDNKGTLRKIYSTINRERVKRPLQSSSELQNTSELSEAEETSTLSPSTIAPSQEKPTRRRYNPSLRLRTTTIAPEIVSQVTEQKFETATEKNESVRRYSSFRRKSSSARTSRISSQGESENLNSELQKDLIVGLSNSDSEGFEGKVEVAQENELENNDSKNRATFAKRNFSKRFQSSRTGSQRTRSYDSGKFNDVTGKGSLSSKTYSTINRSRAVKTSTFEDAKNSGESFTEEGSTFSPTEDTSEYTTVLANENDATTEIPNDTASEIATKENIVTQATTTEFEERSTTTEENNANLNSTARTIQTEEIESKTVTTSGENTKLDEEQTTATIIEDYNSKISFDANTGLSENESQKQSDENTSNAITSKIRERTKLRLNRLKTIDSNKNLQNTVNRTSKAVEAVQKQTISFIRQDNNESNKYATGSARNLYGSNARRKFTTLKQKEVEEESTTASSVEEGLTTDQLESIENDLFASSPSPDSLVTESIESTTKLSVNLNEDEQLTILEDFTTLSPTDMDKSDENETTLDPNFNTPESTEISNKINDNVETESYTTVTTSEDIFRETTTPTIVDDSEEFNATYKESSKQTVKSEDSSSELNKDISKQTVETTDTTAAPKRTFKPGRTFLNSQTKLESATKNEDKSSTDEENNEKVSTTGRTYSGFNRSRLLLKTNQRVNGEATRSRISLNEGSSISEYRKRYGSSRTKSVQTENSKIETIDQKSAPAYSFSTKTRAKFLNRQNLEKSSNDEKNDLPDTQEITSLTENDENSSLSEEVTKLENENREKEISTNTEIVSNLEDENSSTTTSRIHENNTEIRNELKSNQNYSDSSSEEQIVDTNGSKTTILHNADNLEAEIKLENNSSSSVQKSEDPKIRLVRPLPYLKNKSIIQNRKNSIKLAENTVYEDVNLEQRNQDSNDSTTQDFFQESEEENTSNESLSKVNESEVTNIRQSTKSTSQLKFQRKPFPLSRNLPKTLLEKSINETKPTENNFKESNENINIDSNHEESSVSKLSDEITELHETLNEDHTPKFPDSTNSPAQFVNNSANNGLVREDSNLRALNNQTSNPLKFNRRFQKISSGNRFQINNNQNTESSVRTVNGRRVRVLKFKRPSLNTVEGNEGNVNVSTPQRPFVRKFFRKRPSVVATTLSDTEDSIENSEKQNEAGDPPARKFRKILVRKTPVFQEDTEEELQELQLNTTQDSLIQKESSEGKTHLLKVQKFSEDFDLTDDLDIQNEFSDTNTTSSYNNTSNTTENEENESYNSTSTTAESLENAFTDSEFNMTSIEELEQTSGENITTTESDEQSTNTESVETTASTSTTKNKLFASRRPYKPTKPSISAITSTEATSITTKTYVRKYSSNFKIPKPPTEINTNLGANDENGEVFIRPLSSFIKSRPTYRNKIKSIDDENEEDIDLEDEDVESEDFIERNLQQQFDRSQQDREQYNQEQYDREQKDQEQYDREQREREQFDREQRDREQYDREQRDREQYDREQHDREQQDREQHDREQHDREQNHQDQNDRDDFITDSVEDIREENLEPETAPISRPPILQSINRFNSKSSGIPNLIIRLNSGFDSQNEKSELEVIPHSSEESTDSSSASYEYEDEAIIDETSEDEFESAEKLDLPIPSNTPQVQTTKATPLINHSGFIPKRPQNNKPRVINRPTFTTVHPASLKFRVTSPLASTPPSFKTNNTRSYERKYSPSSTEPTSQDNSLIEDLNIDALNARNKKIFEINSRKHTTVKPKPTNGKTNTVESEITTITTTTFNISHNAEQINATTNEILNNFDHLQENVLENVIPPPTTTRRPPPSTTTTKMTTLYHIFALSAEDDATTENNNADEVFTNERREKLVEINRVVEVYSKEDKRKKSKKNQEGEIESSVLKLEKNATLERLGEIGRVSYVKSVEPGSGKVKTLEDGGELVIEGRSTVADYTPTEPIPAGSESGPVRNAIPVLDGTNQSEQKKEARKLQLPEVILGVETSTIPLEGLFEAPRKSKELPVSDEPIFASSLGEVYTMTSETISMVPTVATTNLPPVSIEDTNFSPETTTELPLTTVTEIKTEKPQHYIRPLVPLLRPESNESSPLVISIANLDKVILSKVPRSDSSVASSGRISTFVEPPKSINLLDDVSLSKTKTETSSSQGRNETVVQTQTSFSSEIQVVRKKLPRRSKSTRRRKSKVDEQTN